MTDKKKSGAPSAPEPDEATGVTQDDAGEETTEVVPPAGPDEPTLVATTAPRPSRLRRVLIWLLVLLSCLAVVITGVTWWAHYTVLNTDGYMKIVGPIGKDPQAIQNLSQYIGGEIVSTTDLQGRIQNALPSQVQVLSGPITSYVQDFITKSANKILSTPKAYQLWLQINRLGHEKVVALLRGQTNGVYVQGSDVKLNLLPLISQVLAWVDQRRFDGASVDRADGYIHLSTAGQAPETAAKWFAGRDDLTLVAVDADALGPAQAAVKWFDRLMWILPLITAALMALTIWLSRRRGRTAIALGIGAAIAIFVARVLILRGSQYITAQVKAGTGQSILKDVVHAAIGPLTTITIWVCVIGVIAALVIWLLGRRDVRAGVVAAGKRVAGQTAEIKVPDSPVTTWVVNHVTPVRWVLLVIGLIVLALVTSSWLGIILAIVVELLLQGALSLIAVQWPFEDRSSDGAASA